MEKRENEASFENPFTCIKNVDTISIKGGRQLAF